MIMDNGKKIEIPFGAFDSELIHQEISIPEGFEATIEGNKIILIRAESEEEKIRKEIVKAFKTLGEGKIPVIINFTDIFNWLEKQGEHVEINPTEFDTRLQALIGKFDSLPKEELIGSLSFWLNVVQNDGTYKGEEKQGEQKHTDKAEPKFKVGDWITNGDYTWKIVDVMPLDYALQSQDGNTIVDTISYVDEQFHLWTIQDAKDGDVLAIEPIEGYYSPFVAIYKKQNEEDFNSYCFIGFDGKFYKGENGHSTEEVHPATKEQCDALMKATTDAGYTFDFEKKELKKIEQQSAEWSEEDNKNLERAIWYVEKGGKLIFMKTDKLVSWLKSLRPQNI